MNGTFTKIAAALIAYFTPLAPLVYCILFFILIDFITGVYASYKLKHKVKSRKLRSTLEKFVLYSLSVILAYIFQVEYFTYVNLSQVVGGFIAGNELLSIYENITNITGLNILGKVKGYINKIINRNVNDNQ